MITYHCNNCKHIIGQFDNIKKKYISFSCFYSFTKNSFINFIDCNKCKKFIGLLCYHVCMNCFGYNMLSQEKNLQKWFFEYKKSLLLNKNCCKFCNKKIFRCQYLFFKELIFST